MGRSPSHAPWPQQTVEALAVREPTRTASRSPSGRALRQRSVQVPSPPAQRRRADAAARGAPSFVRAKGYSPTPVSIGFSIFLIALGAILRYAVDLGSVGPVEIKVVGLILMIAGAIGLLVSLLYVTLWSRGRRGDDVVRR
jgi:hypothetical protein